MFSFFRKSHSHHVTKPIAQALATDGLPPGMNPATLDVVDQRGSYSGRQVTYFRLFDPVRLAERAVQVRVYADLDAHPELILGSGHVEHNGAVVLSRQHRTPSPVAATACT
jgi:hypothetical protein